MKSDSQEIYVFMDDSGKLTTKEHYSLYGGLIFLSKAEKMKFANEYKSILKEIKCSYCEEHDCNSECPELKSSNIKYNFPNH